MLTTNFHKLNRLAFRFRRAGFLPCHYVLMRAYGEVFRRLPLEIQGDQNAAADGGAPLDTIRFDENGLPVLVYQIKEKFLRDLVELRATQIYARQWCDLEVMAAEYLR